MDGRKNTSHRGESIAIGCHPKHAAQMNQALKEMGVSSAHYDMQTGNLKWEDRNGRNAGVRLARAIDTDAGYGDFCGE